MTDREMLALAALRQRHWRMAMQLRDFVWLTQYRAAAETWGKRNA
jgi:hypothetical protein